MLDRRAQRHYAAERVAQQVGRVQAEVLDQRRDVVGHQLRPQRPVDVRRAAVALEVDQDHAGSRPAPARIGANISLAPIPPCSITSGSPEPCSSTSLVVKNGSKIRSRRPRRDAGAVVGDLDDAQAPSRRVRIVIVPRSPSASIALSSRFVHTWLSSEPRTVSFGSVAVVVALDLDRRVLELVAEHGERRLEPLVQVDLDQRAAVHVGVGLDRADERGHALGRLAQLGGERVRAVSVAATQRSAGVGRRAGERVRRGRATPRRRPAAASGSASRHASATPSVLERSSSSSSASAASSASSAVAVARARAPRAAARRAARPPRARPRLDEARRSSRDDVERVGQLGAARARRGGRVVELVREAGGHRAQRGEPLAVLLDRRDPLITGATWRITGRCTRGLANAGRGTLGARSRQPAGVSACMRTPSGPPVSTAIAPIQVGASLAADRLGRVRPRR